jgi:hypothetical protein
MAFEDIAVDHDAVTGTEFWRYPGALLKSGTLGVVDDTDVSAQLLTQLHRPFGAAGATGIAVHGQLLGSNRCAGKQREGEQQRRSLAHQLSPLRNIHPAPTFAITASVGHGENS